MAKDRFPSEGDDRMLGIGEVAAFLSVTPGTVHRWISEGKFPKPYIIGDADNPRAAVRYRLADLWDWVEDLPRERPKSVVKFFADKNRWPTEEEK